MRKKTQITNIDHNPGTPLMLFFLITILLVGYISFVSLHVLMYKITVLFLSLIFISNITAKLYVNFL